MTYLWVDDGGALRWGDKDGQIVPGTFVVYEGGWQEDDGSEAYGLSLGRMLEQGPELLHEFFRPAAAIETLAALSRLTPEGVTLAMDTYDMWERYPEEHGGVTAAEAAAGAAAVGLTRY